MDAVLYHINLYDRHFPQRLMDLLLNARVKFAGCQVGRDLSKINCDFNLSISLHKGHNLAGMRLSRGVLLREKGLDSVAAAVICKNCPKLSNFTFGLAHNMSTLS